jgi:glycosyltransferase involved in cell wall biosynthesis
MISVVIPTYNRAGHLKECLEALERQTIAKKMFEVIVVDGGSTDGTSEYLKERAAAGSMRLVYLEEKKKGAGAARNLGVLNSSSEYIAFTDDDCIPDADWLSDLLESFPKDDRCAAIGGPIISAYKKNMISRYVDYCRRCRNLNFSGKVIHLPTMNALYRRTALLEVGIFDERVIITEDIHLSQKILKKGFYLKNLDHGVVAHKDPRDLRTLYHKAYLHGTGIATIAQMHGVKMKKGWMSLLGELVRPKTYAEKFSEAPPPGLAEQVAFAFLFRIWKLGEHNGYLHGMAHISSK